MDAIGKHAFVGIVLIAAFICACFTAYAEVVLVEPGRAACVVVKGEDTGESSTFSHLRRDSVRVVQPSSVLTQAAEDLAGYLNDIGWLGDPRFEVGVVESVEEARAPYRVLLGTAAIAEYGLHEEAAELGFSGYVYRTEGSDLLIFGRTDKGTANGVYGFLQDELGVRWFGPQELFTVLPERKERIAVSGLDERVEPSFTGRFSDGTNLEHPSHPWRRRMRLAEVRDAHQSVGVEPFSGSGHGLHHIINYHDYFETNPEYFRMRGGERRPHSSPVNTNLCWTNPDVIDITVRAVKEHFARGEHYHSLTLGIMDSDAYCECPECEALQPEKYYRGRSAAPQRVASDQYYHFVNEVARRVGEEYPDRYLSATAYNDVTYPPEGDIEPNVYVRMVLDISEHYDESVKAQDRELIELWEKKGVVLGMGYYTGLAKLVPSYFPRHLSEVLKDIHGRGFRGLVVECTPAWWRGPMIYADARLWWDVGLDIEELLDEYFTKLYGPAAPYVSELYGLFEEIHMRPRSGGFLYEHYNFAQFRPYTGEDFERMEELISSAHEAIEEFGTDRLGRANPEERRLAYTTNGLRLFMEMLEGVVLARELEAEELAFDDVGVMEILSRVDRIFELIDGHEKVYREAIIKDPYMHHRYTRDTATVLRDRWKRELFSAAGTALAELYGRRGELDARVKNRLEEYVELYAREPVNRAAFMVRAGMAELGENLVVNPGFEELTGDGSPEGWSVTPGADRRAPGSSADAFVRQEPDERFGRVSARMEGITAHAFWLQMVRGVDEGGFYLFEVDAKLALPEMRSGTNVFMRVQWRGEEAGWIRGRHTYEVSLASLDEWERLSVVGLAPEGADSAAVFLRVDGMTEGEEIFWDNVSVRRIEE